jgi:tetratricopeptide (TPR) repeat protein
MLRDHEAELDDARAARRANSDDAQTLDFEARALGALGRVDEVRALFDEIVARQPRRGWSPSGSLRGLGLSLRAHGHIEVASEALTRALDWYGTLAESDYRGLRYSHAQTLYAAERWPEAKALIDSLRLESPENFNYLGYQGTLAARLGNRDEALRISQELEAIDRPYVFGNPTRWRARIAALLGERDEAVSLLRRAYEEGAGFGVGLLHDMNFESLRGYPPFERFIEPKG